MKVIIEFNMDEDEFIYEVHKQAYGMYRALDDFRELLRQYIKYDDSLTEEQYAIVEKIYDRFFETLSDNNVNLEV